MSLQKYAVKPAVQMPAPTSPEAAVSAPIDAENAPEVPVYAPEAPENAPIGAENAPEAPENAPIGAENAPNPSENAPDSGVSAQGNDDFEPDPDTFVDLLAGPKESFGAEARGSHLDAALRLRPVTEKEVNDSLTILKMAAINAKYCLSDLQLMQLKQLPFDLPAEHQPYGAQFSLAQELDRQLTMTSALRQSIIDPMTGRPKSEVSPREAKEVISACSTLFAMLMKHQETVRTYERQVNFERVISEVVRSHMTTEQREVFLKALGAALEALPN